VDIRPNQLGSSSLTERADPANPYVLGTALGLLSSLVYTAANSFLTAVSHLDPVWVSAVKAVPTVVIMGPIVVLLALRGRRVLPSYPMLAAIAAGGLVGQLGGNILFQWSLAQIGVALTVPLSLGGMILFAAILGRLFLHEPVTWRAALALTILLGAICVLSLGAKEASDEVARGSVSLLWVIAGVAAACVSGLAYSVLNVVLRYCITRGAPLPATLLTVSLCGVLSLTLLSWLRIGESGMAATTRSEWLLMLGAGLCNTVAFISLTKSLQLTSVVWVNALNATQATLAALAGVLIFKEPLSPWLATGIGLTIVGLMVLAHAHRAMRAAEVI
jgi:drug/metabolite transporter (DMT)-like permease